MGKKSLSSKTNSLGSSGLRPQSQAQAGVMAAIRVVKGGGAGARELLAPAIDELIAAGAELLILGCTELPIVVETNAAPAPMLDATEVLLLESLSRSGASAAGGP